MKLADRLHMRTLGCSTRPSAAASPGNPGHLRPIAQRLGMNEMRLSSKTSVCRPLSAAFAACAGPARRAQQPQELVSEIQRTIDCASKRADLRHRHRPRKHLWSIYKKMVAKKRSLQRFHGRVAFTSWSTASTTVTAPSAPSTTCTNRCRASSGLHRHPQGHGYQSCTPCWSVCTACPSR